jgi:hypothetical protein
MTQEVFDPMKSVKFVILFTLAGLLAVSFPIRYAAAQEASVIRASQVDGTVTRNGKNLQEGEIVERGDTLVSQAKSAATLRWSNGSMVRIFPGTTLIVQGVSFDHEKKIEKSYLSVAKGRIFVKAQVPDHLFEHFEVRLQEINVMAQAAEFAVRYDPDEKLYEAFSLIGGVVVTQDLDRIRLDDGRQVKITGGQPSSSSSADEKTMAALAGVSRKMGGSLLMEDEDPTAGGPIKVRIGGLRNRRGNAPYTVKFKALVKGGSGRLKSVRWDFGDGESLEGKQVEHTFTQGVYGVILRVEDQNGETSSAQINISAEQDCNC